MAAQPSLKQLRYLLALAETGHFGKAAQICFITQPSLSAAINDLEELLGIQLVERNKRQVLITPLGRKIVERARIILTDVEELTAIAHSANAPLTGSLKLGVIPTIGPYLLPDLMRELRRGFPDLKPFLREDQTSKLVDQLRAGKIDLALVALPIDEPSLDEMSLFDDAFVFAASHSHKLAGHPQVNLQDLLSENLMLLADGHCLRHQALEVCGSAQNRADFEANSLSTLVQMVASGAGVTLLPQMSLEVEARRLDTLVIRPFSAPAPSRKIGLIWRRSSGRKSEFRELGNYLKHRLPTLPTVCALASQASARI